MVLEKELKTYSEHVAEWREYEGKFVLIRDGEVVDFYTSYEDALKVGYQRFALEPFLVRQVRAVQQAQCVSRLVAPL